MKTVILLGDGMGDYPCDELEHKTPLQAASIPTMRGLAAKGTLYFIDSVPPPLPPGSDVANLGLLGYDPSENYTGRAPIEAAGQRLSLNSNDVAFRCNLVTVEEGIMVDYSAGHISTEEATALMSSLEEALGNDKIRFKSGVSYRHLLIWEDGPDGVPTTPPHDLSDKAVLDALPGGEIEALMNDAKDILEDHPVNKQRIEAGKKPANQIWLWGQGKALSLKTYQELYGLTGTMITAVDLLKGLGHLAGLDVPDIPGVTGFIDTNYQGKVDACIQALRHQDFVYVHVEAPDECGHMGDAPLKTRAIEAFDKHIVNPIWKALEGRGEPYRIVLTMDHRTPVAIKSHTREPVPLALVEGPTGPLNQQTDFDEFIKETPDMRSYEFIQQLLTPS